MVASLRTDRRESTNGRCTLKAVVDVALGRRAVRVGHGLPGSARREKPRALEDNGQGSATKNRSTVLPKLSTVGCRQLLLAQIKRLYIFHRTRVAYAGFRRSNDHGAEQRRLRLDE